MIQHAAAVAAIGVVAWAQPAIAQEEAQDDFGPEHKVEFLLEDAYVDLMSVSASVLCQPQLADAGLRALEARYQALSDRAAKLLGREPRQSVIRLFHCHGRYELDYQRAQRMKQRATRALDRVEALLRQGRLD